MQTSNARRSACEILLRLENETIYANLLLDQELSSGNLSGPDRGLLTELVYGVLRKRATLDHIINQFSSRKVGKLENPVLVLLRLGLYQSFFLDRIPISAAVNETVNLAKIFAPRAAGFVNAVLRQADRERGRIAWPDKGKNLLEYLSVRYSQPSWLIAQWVEQLGADAAESLAEAMSEIPPLTLRTNTLRISREELLARFAAENIGAERTTLAPDGVRILSPTNPAMLPGFREGLFTVQDESSQLASIFLAPVADEVVLDACAAPGGKATHIAQLMENRGSVLACDNQADKLPLIAETAGRLGITIIRTEVLDAAQPVVTPDDLLFDRVLVDAPCSGLGVLRRHPEGKWRKTHTDVQRLAVLQKTILANLAERVKSGGVLLYSTCSTAPEENEAVVDEFLTARSDFMVEDLRKLFPNYTELCTGRGFFRGWPHRYGMDGFFAARLRRK